MLRIWKTARFFILHPILTSDSSKDAQSNLEPCPLRNPINIETSSMSKWRFFDDFWNIEKTALKVNRVFGWARFEISLRIFWAIARQNRLHNKFAIDESSRMTRIDDDSLIKPWILSRKCMKTCVQGQLFMANSKLEKKSGKIALKVSKSRIYEISDFAN